MFAQKSWPQGQPFCALLQTNSGGTDSGVRPEKEQADDEKHSHASSCCNEPERQNAFSPAGAPSHCWASVGKTIWNTTIGIERFFAAHDSESQLKK
jgi:hypothetical protein